VNAPRRIVLMLALAAALVATGVALNYLLNPYGAWRTALIDPIFRKVEHERVVTPYLLRTAAPETLLVGSSRVLMGMRIEQGERDDVMNGALTAATIPQLAAIVDLALARNPRLKRIVWGVDFFTFDAAWDRVDQSFNERIAGNRALKVEDTLLSLQALDDGYEMWNRARRGVAELPPIETAPVPWPMDFICEQFRAESAQGLDHSSAIEVATELSQDLPDYSAYRFSPAFLALFRASVERARRRGVEVIMFIPPMSQYELELIRQGGRWRAFQNFKRSLMAIGPLWDFSGYNAMARDDAMFMHVMHFKTAAGMEMLRIMMGLETAACSESAAIVEESGVLLGPSTIDQAIAAEDKLAEEAARRDSRYSRMAAEAIARRERGHREVSAEEHFAPAGSSD
jgi:hypothetical protein